MQPLVSVLVRTFNQKEYVGDAISSAVNQQTDFPFEILVRDDASTDGTVETIQKLSETYPDVVRVLPASSHKGPSFPSLLPLWIAARGEFIAILDGDDQWIGFDRLQKQVDVLREDARVSVCYVSARVLIETETHLAPFESSSEDVLSRHASSIVARKSAFQSAFVKYSLLGFDVLASISPQIVELDYCGTLVRRHPESWTARQKHSPNHNERKEWNRFQARYQWGIVLHELSRGRWRVAFLFFRKGARSWKRFIRASLAVALKR